MPQMAMPTPTTPPINDSMRLSVSNCRITVSRSGSEAQPNRDLPAARGGARHQEAGDVGAGNGEDEHHHREEHIERIAVAAPQPVEPTDALLDQRALGVIAKLLSHS